MDSKNAKLEEEFRKKMKYIADHLKALYETASELEQSLDLYDLRILALHKPILVPRIGYLGNYDFESDENLSVVEEGILRMEKFSCKEDLQKAEVCFGDSEKFVKLDMEVFLPPFDEEELKDFYDEGYVAIPFVQVKTVEEKEFEDSDSDFSESSDSEED